MHSKRFAISLCLLLAAGGLYIADRQAGSSQSGQEEIESLLRQQNSAAYGRLEKNVLNADHLVQDILTRVRKKDDSYESLLQLTEAPKQLIYEGKRFKSFDFHYDSELFSAMENHLNSKDPYSIYLKEGKPLLLVAGEFRRKPYVASYDKDVLLASVAESSGFRTWIASSSGVMLFHPQARFIGADVGNFKPVAAGILAVQGKKRQEIVSHYTGLDGVETLGVWASFPERAFIVGTDLGRYTQLFQKNTSSNIHYGFLLCFALGLILLARSFGEKGNADFSSSQYEFDLDRLNAEEKAFLYRAKSTAEAAVEARNKVEKELETANEQARKYFGEYQGVLSYLDLWNSFSKFLLEGATGKQVWKRLVPLFSEKLMGTSVFFYRFSETSYALVPEAVVGIDHFGSSAQLYLTDARIFLGDFRKIPEILDTQAFQNWNEARKRHMPLGEFESFVISIEGATRGALLFLLPKELVNADSIRTLQYFEDFVSRVSPLCELKPRLLQSKNAKLEPGPAVAGPSNQA